MCSSAFIAKTKKIVFKKKKKEGGGPCNEFMSLVHDISFRFFLSATRKDLARNQNGPLNNIFNFFFLESNFYLKNNNNNKKLCDH